MREYLISAARHVSGAAIGAIAAFLTSQGLIEVVGPDLLMDIQAGIEAVVVGVGLAAYALAEKGLKPLIRGIFGSEGGA